MLLGIELKTLHIHSLPMTYIYRVSLMALNLKKKLTHLHVYVNTCMLWHIYVSQKIVISHMCVLRDLIQVIWLSSKCLYQLSYLMGPDSEFSILLL